MAHETTVDRLLDSAEDLVRTRGYNAFSYRDLADFVGIRTASIHYHFPSKADLAEALMERYVQELERSLATIDAQAKTNRAKLERFIDLYRDTESRGAICLCGSLASDQDTLPEAVQEAVAHYLELGETWIAQKLKEGSAAGEFGGSVKPRDAARTLVASLQGGLILARAKKSGESVLRSVRRTFFSSLDES